MSSQLIRFLKKINNERKENPKMERKQRFMCVLSVFIIGGVLLLPIAGQAIAILDFDIGAPTGGYMEYIGGDNPLSGRGITVDYVVGIGTPVNDGGRFFSDPDHAYLNFDTGNLTSYSENVWHFGSGGFINIFYGTFLLTGTITNATVQPLQGQGFNVTFGSFIDTKDPELLKFYGLPDGNYSGGFNLQFTLDIDPSSGGFRSAKLLSGDVTNTTTVPEPATMLLLGSGLLGLIGIRRKFKK
jgi:hypothetical protein